MEACPSSSFASGILYNFESQPPKPPDVFLLKFCCHDRKGLLHGKIKFFHIHYAMLLLCFAILLLILYCYEFKRNYGF